MDLGWILGPNSGLYRMDYTSPKQLQLVGKVVASPYINLSREISYVKEFNDQPSF